jgi:hypothetical protein
MAHRLTMTLVTSVGKWWLPRLHLGPGGYRLIGRKTPWGDRMHRTEP